MRSPTATTKQPQIHAAIAEVVREMTPAVQRIDYEIAQDWTGEWAIFFKVLLSNEASKRTRLRSVAPRVVRRMSDNLDLPTLGLIPYFDFRSQAEEDKLKEPARA